MAYGRRVMYIKIEERWPIISHSFSYSQQWFVCVYDNHFGFGGN